MGAAPARRQQVVGAYEGMGKQTEDVGESGVRIQAMGLNGDYGDLHCKWCSSDTQDLNHRSKRQHSPQEQRQSYLANSLMENNDRSVIGGYTLDNLT